MKTIITILFSLAFIYASSQTTFLKSYPYWQNSQGYVIIEEPDCYVIAGIAQSEPVGNYDRLFVLKVNYSGDTIWTKTFPTTYSGSVTSYTSDAHGNRYIISHSPAGNVHKFDSNWNLIYTGNFELFDGIIEIKLLADNSFFVITDHWGELIPYKINSENFDLIWYGDVLENEYHGYVSFVAESPEGKIVVVKNNWGLDPLEIGSTVYCLSSEGNLIEQYDILDYVLGTTVFEGENLLSLAYHDRQGGYNALIRYQTDGTIISTNDISVENYSFRHFIKDGNRIVMAGNYFGPNLNFYNIAIGSVIDGEIEWSYNYREYQSPYAKYYSAGITKTTDNGYLIGGSKQAIDYSSFLLKTDFSGLLVGLKPMNCTNKFKAYPIPATDILTIEGSSMHGLIELYSPTGILLSGDTFNENYKLNISSLPKGVYFAKLITSRETVIVKFIKN